jgi:hypothetical protein
MKRGVLALALGITWGLHGQAPAPGDKAAPVPAPQGAGKQNPAAPVQAPAQPATVPDVIGRTRDDAIKLIEGQKLKAVFSDAQARSDVQKDRVIKQSPDAKAPVSGPTVTLTLSSGPGVPVPNVVGKTIVEATTAITGVKLQVDRDLIPAPSTFVPSGSVIDTTPRAGATANIGSSIRLTVSIGPPTAKRTIEIYPLPPGGNAPAIVSALGSDGEFGLAPAGNAHIVISCNVATCGDPGRIEKQIRDLAVDSGHAYAFNLDVSGPADQAAAKVNAIYGPGVHAKEVSADQIELQSNSPVDAANLTAIRSLVGAVLEPTRIDLPRFCLSGTLSGDVPLRLLYAADPSCVPTPDIPNPVQAQGSNATAIATELGSDPQLQGDCGRRLSCCGPV